MSTRVQSLAAQTLNNVNVAPRRFLKWGRNGPTGLAVILNVVQLKQRMKTGKSKCVITYSFFVKINGVTEWKFFSLNIIFLFFSTSSQLMPFGPLWYSTSCATQAGVECDYYSLIRATDCNYSPPLIRRHQLVIRWLAPCSTHRLAKKSKKKVVKVISCSF